MQALSLLTNGKNYTTKYSTTQTMQYFQGYINTILYNVLFDICIMYRLSVLCDITLVFTTLLNPCNRFTSYKT